MSKKSKSWFPKKSSWVEWFTYSIWIQTTSLVNSDLNHLESNAKSITYKNPSRIQMKSIRTIIELGEWAELINFILNMALTSYLCQYKYMRIIVILQKSLCNLFSIEIPYQLNNICWQFWLLEPSKWCYSLYDAFEVK